jgi:glyoxylase-like metal-dependent hydrolase (beta-lactamase superfamily II)
MSCAYLIENGNGLFLVDAGGPGAESVIERKMRVLGRQDLRLIYLTHAHFDHYAGAGALRRATGAPVAIHRTDAGVLALGGTAVGTARSVGKLMSAFLPLAMRLLNPQGIAADVLLEDGDALDTFGLEAVVVHTPGHTLGSSSLLVEGHSIFVGDLITSNWGVRPQRLFAQDWEQVGESVRRVQELHPQWVYGGHGCQAFPGEALRRLE